MKNRSLFILPLLTVFLCSCGLWGTTVIDYNTSAPDIPARQPDEGDGYKKYSNFDFNLQDVKKTIGLNSLKSKGESALLVVPVKFSDGPNWTASKLDVVKKGFFGTQSEVSWQSVASFYYSASYGNLTIKGEVAHTLEVPVTISEASKHLSDGQAAPDELMLQYFDDDTSYDSLRKQYDVNKDGYIDSVVFVYSNDINSKAGYWAWVYWADYKASTTRPTVNSYLWMSYSFFTGSKYAGYESGIDSHTATHEVGHLLGLDDYYQYDDDDKFDPSGAIEMHSYNIGDENIYSKFALGWVNPYYVKTDSSVTLELRSSAFYGDAIILNDSWNGNSMDEYIIIEYYTPQGMNEQDAKSAYKPNGDKANRMYTVNGFRIYHIDSRIVELEARGTMKGYVDSLGKGYYAVGASNSPSRSHLSGKNAIDFKYVHLLESNGTNTFKNGGIATNDTLFKKGSSFVATSEFFPNGSKFNDGTEVGYRININNCENEFGSITISKI